MPYQLTSNMKMEGLEVRQRLLAQDESDSDDFLHRIITGGKSWVHHHDPQSRSQSPNTITPLLSQRKKFQGSIFCWKARGSFSKLRKVSLSTAIRRDTKFKIFNACVKSVLLYGCETWLVTSEIRR